MTAQAPNRSPNLADQAREIAAQASDEMAEHEKVRAALASETPRKSHDRLILRSWLAALPVLAVALAVNVFGLSPMELFTPAPPPEVARATAQQELDFTVTEIESFRKDYKELPPTLVEVAAPKGGEWIYTRTAGGRYNVVRRLHGQVATFHSPEGQVQDEPNP